MRYDGGVAGRRVNMDAASAVSDARPRATEAHAGAHGRSAPLVLAGARRRGRDYQLRRLLLWADLLALLCGLATWSLTGAPHLEGHLLWGVLALPLWILVFNVYGLYRSGLRRVGYSTVDDIQNMAHAYLVCAIGSWLYFQVTPPGKLVFGDLLALVATAFVLSLIFRSLVRKVALATLGMERVMFVGSGPMTPILVRQLLQQRRHGMEPVAVLTQPENERWPLSLPSAGRLADVDPEAVLDAYGIDRVIVSAEGIEDDSLLELINLCRKLGIKISTLPSLSAMMGSAATIDHLEGITLIGLHTPSLARSSRVLKRAMDVAGASALLVLTAPLWAVIAIAIKLGSPGPVLFRQNRVGRGGKHFQLTKFRSMVNDAEARRAALLAESRQEGWLDLEHDPRITRVGRLLRLTSLDELPQLWNVVRGDMSLVGPRPLIAEEDINVNGYARARLDLTPGITGPWQVLGRTSIPFEQMIMLDYLYVANWSLWTDVKLMMQTVPAVLTRRGAN